MHKASKISDASLHVISIISDFDLTRMVDAILFSLSLLQYSI